MSAAGTIAAGEGALVFGDGAAVGIDFGAVIESGVPVQCAICVPPHLSAVKAAFGVVELVEVGPAVGAPHALAANVAAKGVGVEMVVGSAIGVVAHLFDKPSFQEALEPPTVVAVDQDVPGPSGVGLRRVGLVHAPDLVAPDRSAFPVDAPVGRKDRMLGIRCHPEEDVERRHGGVAVGEGTPRRARRCPLPPRLGPNGRCHCPTQSKTEEKPHHSNPHDGKFGGRG